MTPAPEPVRPHELQAAFRLLFQHVSPLDRQGRIDSALGLVDRRELDPAGLFVLHSRGELVGAVLGLVLPGSAALVWPPQCVPSVHRAAREDALLQSTADWLRGRNVQVAQALLSPEESSRADTLPRNGFPHVTHLWFLRHDLLLPSHLLKAPTRLNYRSYAACDVSLFHQTLQRTYENTLDCPELNGSRGVEQVIAGHRPPGPFNPDHWLMALADGDPVGVLLLMEALETGEWETSYVGVVPEARRRGLGREMMLKALWEAHEAGARRLTLSVDARNEPAWDLYRGLGFKVFDRREVYLAVWR